MSLAATMSNAALASVLAAVLGGTAWAQTTLRATSTLVVVPTLVQAPDRDVVFALRAEDFVLTDNGVPQKLTLEDESNRPLALVVLMQTGGAARGQFASYAHLDTMLASLAGAGPNRVSIVNFDSKPEAASPFTPDVEEWRDAITDPDVGDKGAAIFDAILFGLGLLKKQPPEMRRAILLLSQTHDDGSKASLKEAVRAIAETNTAIYSVTFSAEATAIKQAFKAEPKLNPPLLGIGQAYFDLSAPLALAIGAMRKNLAAEVADLSGGEASSFGNRMELEKDLNLLSNHIHNSYMLSFYPTAPTPGLHSISVRLAGHPGLRVSARSNYWVDEESASDSAH